MERSLMVWLVDYLMNSAWQAPLVLLVAMVAARLVARLYSAAAVHWTWVSARIGVTDAKLCESPAVLGPAMVGLRTVLLPAGFIEKVGAKRRDEALAFRQSKIPGLKIETWGTRITHFPVLRAISASDHLSLIQR